MWLRGAGPVETVPIPGAPGRARTRRGGLLPRRQIQVPRVGVLGSAQTKGHGGRAGREEPRLMLFLRRFFNVFLTFPARWLAFEVSSLQLRKLCFERVK